MGCGGDTSSERLASVKAVLSPMWRVLPKNKHDNVEWAMVRYLAHRYFMQTGSLLVRGFEPIRQINASYIGAPRILGDRASSIQSGVQSDKGFSLDDIAAMVATLEELIAEDEHQRLQKVYEKLRKATNWRLSVDDLSKVLETYMVHWMVDEEELVINALLRNKTLREEALPKWSEIRNFVDGVAKTLQFQGQQNPSSQLGLSAFDGSFSFSDAQKVISKVTTGFASFWENECQVIKESLVELDKSGTGRVSLSAFYGANSDGEWRFGESEAYLRDLGALDESQQDKQVIIPNYLQGASNCIVATSNYLVCCVNECEGILNELEDTIGAAVAEPEEILAVVANTSDLNDDAIQISGSLRTQLLRIAETHGGKVPLHGRLFAQWLHYAFPRECPFPHKSGTASAMTPSQYGDSFIASSNEVATHAASRDSNVSSSVLEDLSEAHFMSQWSEEEELLVDYSLHLEAPWERRGAFRTVAIVLLGLIALGLGVVSLSGSPSTVSSSFASIESKAHYV